MLDISIRQLEVFVATAEYWSFTKAAEDLHLTQSTDSMHIRTLEEVLNTCLIERGARKKVILTEEGKRVYTMAKDILSRMEALQERRSEGAEEPLRIGGCDPRKRFFINLFCRPAKEVFCCFPGRRIV